MAKVEVLQDKMFSVVWVNWPFKYPDLCDAIKLRFDVDLLTIVTVNRIFLINSYFKSDLSALQSYLFPAFLYNLKQYGCKFHSEINSGHAFTKTCLPFVVMVDVSSSVAAGWLYLHI